MLALPELYVPSVQQQTGQATAEAALSSAQGRLGSYEKAEAGRPGGCLPGGLSLALTSQSARPGEALLASMPRSLSSLPRPDSWAGHSLPSIPTRGRGTHPTLRKP